MDEILSEILLNTDLKEFIQNIGLVGVFLIVFAESGLLIGFFLPGDSLLFTAGLLSSPAFNVFNFWALLITSWIAAIVGDNVGYEFGKRVGRKLYDKKDSKLFKKAHLKRAENFYKEYGGKAVIYSRFFPLVRTFAPIVAGMANMDHKIFTFYNFIGGTVWVWTLIWLGYYLGTVIPDADKYLIPALLIIVCISVLPGIYHYMRENKKNKKDDNDHLIPDPVMLP